MTTTNSCGMIKTFQRVISYHNYKRYTPKGVMSMNDKKNEKKCLCTQCEFHNTKQDNCTEKGIKKCSKKNITECETFLVKDKLVHF